MTADLGAALDYSLHFIISLTFQLLRPAKVWPFTTGLTHPDPIDKPGGLGQLPVILAVPALNVDRAPEHLHGELE